MSKKVISVFLGLVLLAVILVFVVKQGDDKAENVVVDGGNTNSEMEVKPTMVVGEGSLSDLLARNENLECSIVYKRSDGADDVVEGSYFTSNGKMRGDFLTKDSGEEVLSSMIIKDGTFYSWSVIEGEKFGMKANLEQMQTIGSDDSKPKADNGPVSLDQSVKYDCKPWNSVDGSVFEPPSNVLFRDYSTIINTGMEYGNIYDDNGGDRDRVLKELQKEME